MSYLRVRLIILLICLEGDSFTIQFYRSERTALFSGVYVARDAFLIGGGSPARSFFFVVTFAKYFSKSVRNYM